MLALESQSSDFLRSQTGVLISQTKAFAHLGSALLLPVLHSHIVRLFIFTCIICQHPAKSKHSTDVRSIARMSLEERGILQYRHLCNARPQRPQPSTTSSNPESSPQSRLTATPSQPHFFLNLNSILPETRRTKAPDSAKGIKGPGVKCRNDQAIKGASCHGAALPSEYIAYQVDCKGS